MTFKEYAKHVANLLKDNPETADFVAIFASDDEGNVFSPVIFHPGTGEFNEVERTLESDDESTPNAVCIN
jgi:hypothetical protein